MNIGLIGASGMIGSRILDEAVKRGHRVRAVVRNPEKVASQPGVTAIAGDATEAASIAATTAGLDVVISAYGPGAGPDDDLLKNAHALLDGLASARVPRVIVVGGAGSLENESGERVVDSPHFPEIYKKRSLQQAAAYEVFRAASDPAVTWTFVSPAMTIAPGRRTGTFRVGGDRLMFDAHGESKISAEDFAVAILDEAEVPKAPNRRISVAY